MTLFGIRAERRALVYLAGDALIAALAIVLAQALRFGFKEALDPIALLRTYTGASGLFFATNVLFLYIFEGYDATRDFRERLHLFHLGVAVACGAIAQMALFYTFPDWWWGRGLVAFSNGLFLAGTITWRTGMSWFRPRLVLPRRALIVGAGPPGRHIEQIIRAHVEHGMAYRIVGFVDDSPGDDVLGPVAELSALVAAHRVDLVLVAVFGSMEPALTKELLACKGRGVVIEDMRYRYEKLLGKVPIEYLHEAALVFGPSFAGTSGPTAAIQRLVDIALSSLGLILVSPVLGLAILALKRDSPGPAFYRQERIGLGERPFMILKLRTMVPNAEARTGPVWSQGGHDPRVTRVGRFLRRSRLDEVPQLLNVLRGEMSIIGPRPEREPFVSQLASSIPFYSLRFVVRPGVTGWAQVKYRYGASEEDAAEKLRYDLYAIQSMNPALYLLILLKTIQTVIMKAGS